MSKSLGNVVAPQEVVDAKRRRHPAPLGRRLGLFRRSAHRHGDPEVPGRRLSPAAQHAALSARRARRLQRRRSALAARRCRSSSARSCIASPRSMRWCARRSEAYDFHTHVHGAAQFLRRRSLGLLFRCPQGFALLRPRRMRRARRAARTVLDRAVRAPGALARAGAVLHRRGSLAQRVTAMADGISVHLQLFPDIPAAGATTRWRAKWAKIRELRRVVTGAIELERAQKRIGSSLQAACRDLR